MTVSRGEGHNEMLTTFCSGLVLQAGSKEMLSDISYACNSSCIVSMQISPWLMHARLGAGNLLGSQRATCIHLWRACGVHGHIRQCHQGWPHPQAQVGLPFEVVPEL